MKSLYAIFGFILGLNSYIIINDYAKMTTQYTIGAIGIATSISVLIYAVCDELFNK